MRSLIVLLCLAASCTKPPAVPAQIDVYQFTGEIVSLDSAKSKATIKHGPMTDSAGKVWMEGMTMEFPVKEPQEFASLKPGIKVKGKLFQRPADMQYWIAELAVIP